MSLADSFEFVKNFEKVHGTLNLYDSPLGDVRLSKEQLISEITNDQYDFLVTRFGSIDDAKHWLNDNISPQDLVEFMYRPYPLQYASNLVMRLLPDVWRIVSGIYVAPVSVPLFNAAAVRSPAGFDVVVINLPLILELGGLNSVLWEAWGAGINLQWDRLPDLRATFASELTRVCSLSRDTFGKPQGSYMSKDPFAVALSAQAVLIQVLFVLLHEYAHVVLGHLNQAALERMHPLDRQRTDAKIYTQSQLEEFDADLWAFERLVAASPEELFEERPEFAVTPAFVPLSLVNFFAVLAGLSLGHTSDTHPDAISRAHRLLEVLPNNARYDKDRDIVAEYLSFVSTFLANRDSRIQSVANLACRLAERARLAVDEQRLEDAKEDFDKAIAMLKQLVERDGQQQFSALLDELRGLRPRRPLHRT